MGYAATLKKIGGTLGCLKKSEGVSVYLDDAMEGTKPEFIVWYPTEVTGSYADNSRTPRAMQVTVEAYICNPDSRLPDTVEALFRENGYAVGNPTIHWDDDFSCQRWEWEIEVLIL